MARPKLESVIEGRDPAILAETVKACRLAMGMSTRAFAEAAKIGRQSLQRIEKGMGCTPLIDRKLASFMRMGDGTRLWQPLVVKHHSLHKASTDRWFFLEMEEWNDYVRRRSLAGVAELHRDAEAIQDEEERLRLGRSGLSSGFARATAVNLLLGNAMSDVNEVFGKVRATLDPRSLYYFYCLRGGVRIQIDGHVTELEENDVFVSPGGVCMVEPLTPVGLTDLPPLVINVGFATIPAFAVSTVVKKQPTKKS